MVRGFTLDQSQAATFIGQWFAGIPERSWVDFFGQLTIKPPPTGGKIPIGTFRCRNCGFLESYALNEFRPD